MRAPLASVARAHRSVTSAGRDMVQAGRELAGAGREMVHAGRDMAEAGREVAVAGRDLVSRDLVGRAVVGRAVAGRAVVGEAASAAGALCALPTHLTKSTVGLLPAVVAVAATAAGDVLPAPARRELVESAASMAGGAAAATSAATSIATSFAAATAASTTSIALSTTSAAVSTASAATSNAASTAGSVAESMAGSVTDAARSVPARSAKALADLVPAIATASASTFGDLKPVRHRRRVWTGNGRAHIEIRGLAGRGPHHRRLTKAVTSALSELRGVDWAAVNAATQQVLVSFDDGELSTGDLIDIVESVEDAHDTGDDTFPWARQHPADTTNLAAPIAVLAMDAVALAVTLLRPPFSTPVLPRGARAPIAIVEAQPRLWEVIARRVGPVNAELLIGLANAAVNGLSRAQTPLALDMLFRTLHLGEQRARREVWLRREPELCSSGEHLPQETHERAARPAPLPKGAIERIADRISLASLVGGGGVLAWTHSPEQAAHAMLVLLPRAARFGREGFSATLTRDLCRRGAVPLDSTAFRLLDRIDTIVIDSGVLCGARPQILSAAATTPDLRDADVWRIAGKVVRGHRLDEMRGEGPWSKRQWTLCRAPDAARGRPDGATALTLDLYDSAGTRLGRVRVGCELDPLADAMLGAARHGADRLVLTAHDSMGDILPWADHVLQDTGPLVEQIRAMQEDGHGVMLIAGGHGAAMNAELDAALDAADVAMGVLPGTGSVPWSADLLVGPGLTDACRLMHALPAARKVSDRAARLGLGGSALGALVSSVGRPGRSALGLAPVHSAALLALLGGVLEAKRVAAVPDPEPVTRAAWHTLTAEDALDRLSTAVRPPAREAAARHGLRAVAGSVRSRIALPEQVTTLPHRLTLPDRLTLPHRLTLPDRLTLAPGITVPTGKAQASRMAQAAGLTRPSAWITRPASALMVAPARGTVELFKAMGEELHDPLTPVLALGAAASAIVGSSVDAWLVASVITGNAAVSSLQRIRAERALSKLLLSEELPARKVLWTPPDADVVDDLFADLTTAEVEKIPSHRLNIGDIIMLAPSDVVPADARLLLVDDLEVDESSLTGESLPVTKTTEPTPAAALADRTCMVYEGSAILAGTGYAVVVATGAGTQSGRATAAAGRAAPPAGLQVHLSELTRVALPATGFAGLAVTGLGLLRGVPLRDAVSSGIAIAVAAVPEGLPLVATVSQLAAARRLSRQGVLVRSSRSLEALGRVDTICFDKTGTLTEGRLAVTRVAGPGGDIDLDSPLGRRLLQVAAHASPQPDGTGRLVMAHATDRAIVEGARAHRGLDDGWWLIDELPFETSRGYAASLGKENGRLHLAVKGAPEVVLARCSSVLTARGKASLGKAQRANTARAKSAAAERGASATVSDDVPAAPMTAARQRAAQALVRRLAEDGLRVLAVAERRLNAGQDPAEIEVTDAAEDLTLLGFVAIADVARPSAAAAVKRLSESGVRVTMITGDHPITAVAIAKILGLPDADQVLTGVELEVLPEDERIARIAASTVFARVSPEQKVGIVQALQRAGHVVAMTGDGSNDAPAIRLADVGIGVSGHGSAVARNAADLVLADPDIGRIVDAVLEGRALWSSVRDAVSILVGGNAGEVAFTLLATAIAGRAPLGTRQFLLVNLLTDMLPSLAVALAPAKAADEESQDSSPLTAGPVPSVLGPELARTIAVRGAATAFGATLAWQLGCWTGRRRRASTMALAALVGAELGQTLLTSSHSPLVITTVVVSGAILAAIVETPGVSTFFQCTPLGPVAWTIVLGSAAAGTLSAVIATRAVESRAVESRAVGTRAVGTRAVGTRAVGTRAVGTRALESRAVETRALESGD